MEYTVIFLFDESRRHVLLQKKNRGPYPDKLNGIGGKRILHPVPESVMECAYREMKEETGLTQDDCELHLVTTIEFYRTDVILHVLTGIGNIAAAQQLEDEPLIQCYARNLDYNQLGLAGGGDIPWLLKLCSDVLDDRCV